MTRAEAKAAGARFYVGKPCPRGHVAQRRVSDKKCTACNAEKCRARRAKRVDEYRERDRTRYRKPERRAYQFAQADRWWRENRGKKNAMTARARSWIRQATPAWLTAGQRAAIRAKYAEAAAHGPGIMEVDHIVPLRGKLVCGLHVPWNLRVVPKAVNRKKANKHGAE